MKISFRIVLLLVGVTLIVSGPSALAHTDVSAEQALNLIDSTDDLIVVDVREPSEYCDDTGHIPGALNYPWYSGVLEAQYGEFPTDGPVLVVCGSGGRSNRAADFLDSEGFSMVYDMLGGMRAWTWETEPCDDPDSKYGGGAGEPNDPYLIYTGEQLNAIGDEPNDWDKHFKLMADVDLSEYTAADFNIIGFYLSGDFGKMPFTGVFDGNGRKISNFSYASEDTGSAALFGFVTGVVKDLALIDPNIDAGTESSVGSLIGLLSDSGLVFNCCAEGGSVSGNEDVGGLVGSNHYGGTITDCYSTSNVSGNRFVGGLVGSNRSTMTNCYAAGNVSANEDVGGLVGWNDYGTIANCYSVGSVRGPGSSGAGPGIGGLVGSNTNSINDSFWDVQTSEQPASAGGAAKTTAEMQTLSTFTNAGWDFVGETENGTEDIWSICEGTNYPRFVWQIAAGDFVCPDGITIDDFSFFLEFWLDDNCDLSNDYCQGTDLDQSGTVDVNDLEIFYEYWSAEQ